MCVRCVCGVRCGVCVRCVCNGAPLYRLVPCSEPGQRKRVDHDMTEPLAPVLVER